MPSLLRMPHDSRGENEKRGKGKGGRGVLCLKLSSWLLFGTRCVKHCVIQSAQPKGGGTQEGGMHR